MLININGHFVVALFNVSASFARLSVPPMIAMGSTDLFSFGSNHPNTDKATNEASNSAEVEAHCAPPSGLKRKGTSSLVSSRTNHLPELSSHPPRTTASSVHFASVLKHSSANLRGRATGTMYLFASSSNAMYFNVKITVSGSLPTVPRAVTEAQAYKGDRCGFNHVMTCATNPNRPRNSAKLLFATTKCFDPASLIQARSHLVEADELRRKATFELVIAKGGTNHLVSQ